MVHILWRRATPYVIVACLVGMELDSEEKDSIWEALDAKSDGSVSLSEAITALDVLSIPPFHRSPVHRRSIAFAHRNV